MENIQDKEEIVACDKSTESQLAPKKTIQASSTGKSEKILGYRKTKERTMKNCKTCEEQKIGIKKASTT